MNRFVFGLAFLAMTVLPPAALSAGSVSDIERERSWADQIVDFLVTGEPVWLEARGVKFLGLYTPAARRSAGEAWGVILLHGRGVHPAWGFLEPLRANLADAGWHTLALQMPILAPDVKLADYARTFDEAFERIDAGLAFLAGRGVTRVVLLGHSIGAMTALAYAAEHPGRTAGIVAIGAPTEPLGGKRMQPASLLREIRDTPVLDLYGSEDLPVVLDEAQARAQAARAAGNAGYRQLRVQGANHFFTDRYAELEREVVSWLATLRRAQRAPGRADAAHLLLSSAPFRL